jgi:hypothetical protein
MTSPNISSPTKKKPATGLIFKARTGMIGWSDARLAEVDFHPAMGYFLKIDGENKTSGKTEQVQIWLNDMDTADLIALLTKLMIKNGGTASETLHRFLELRS